MFTIIGGDGNEYGPASVDQIRGWIAAGRASLNTQAKAVGSDEWRRLGDFAEFAVTDTAPPVIGTSGSDLADPWLRLGAWFLDNVIAFICCLPGLMLLGFSVLRDLLMGQGAPDATLAGRALLGATLLTIGGLVLLVVQIWLLTTRGQTLGKRIVGVRIVNVLDDANPGFVRAVLLRWFVPGLITFVLNFLPPLGFIFFIVDSCFIFRRDRRCVHDLIAGTRVVTATVPAAAA
jgi:uncharacterized RDD family membrane protein YckC